MATPQSANVGDTPSPPGPVPSGVKMPDFSKYSQEELARISPEDRKKIWRVSSTMCRGGCNYM
jgi:hypothetical protein